MEFRDCLPFATENPVYHLPPPKAINPGFVFYEYGLPTRMAHFCGLALKSAWRQIRATPKVEICSLNHATDLQDVRSMRVTRKAEFLEKLEQIILREAKAERIRSDPCVSQRRTE